MYDETAGSLLNIGSGCPARFEFPSDANVLINGGAVAGFGVWNTAGPERHGYQTP